MMKYKAFDSGLQKCIKFKFSWCLLGESESYDKRKTMIDLNNRSYFYVY